MRIEDVVKRSGSDIGRVRDFLDADVSGEVYRTAELRRRLSLRANALDSSGEYEYRYVVRSNRGNAVAWWGNPLAIKRLKEAVAKNGQT